MGPGRPPFPRAQGCLLGSLCQAQQVSRAGAAAQAQPCLLPRGVSLRLPCRAPAGGRLLSTSSREPFTFPGAQPLGKPPQAAPGATLCGPFFSRENETARTLPFLGGAFSLLPGLALRACFCLSRDESPAKRPAPVERILQSCAETVQGGHRAGWGAQHLPESAGTALHPAGTQGRAPQPRCCPSDVLAVTRGPWMCRLLPGFLVMPAVTWSGCSTFFLGCLLGGWRVLPSDVHTHTHTHTRPRTERRGPFTLRPRRALLGEGRARP